MTEQQAAKKSITPPKGRPTRARNEAMVERRAFGPTAQWIAFVFLVAVLFVLLIVFFDGGDFNPFNSDNTGNTGSVIGSIVGAAQPSP